MLIYAIVCCLQAQGAIICVCIVNCNCIYIIVFYFVFSAVFIEVGQYLPNFIAFWLYVWSFVYVNSKLFNTSYNINVFVFVIFHTTLTVAQNTQIAYLTIIPECYIVYLVVFPSCASPGSVLSTLEGEYSNCPPNRGIPL